MKLEQLEEIEIYICAFAIACFVFGLFSMVIIGGIYWISSFFVVDRMNAIDMANR